MCFAEINFETRKNFFEKVPFFKNCLANMPKNHFHSLFS